VPLPRHRSPLLLLPLCWRLLFIDVCVVRGLSDGSIVETWMSAEESQCVQRFDPVPSSSLDTIGFFIAKFIKHAEQAVVPDTDAEAAALLPI